MPKDPVGDEDGILQLTVQTVVWKVVALAVAGIVGVVTSRQLGPGGRGVLVLFVAVASFSLLLSSLGVNTSARLLLVEPEEPLLLSDYLGLCGVLLVAHMALCAALGVVLLPLVSVPAGLSDYFLLALLGGSLLAQYFVHEALNAFGLVIVGAGTEAAAGGAHLLIVVSLALGGARTAAPYLAAMTMGAVVQVVAGLIVLRRSGYRLRPSCNWAAWTRLVRVGLGSVVVNVGQVLTFRIDRYLVGLFLNPAAVGMYSVAGTPPELLRLPTLALGQAIFYRLASRTSQAADFRRARRLCLGATLGLSVVCFAVAPVAVPAVFGSAFKPAVTPLRVLLLAEVGIAFYQLDGSALYGLNRIGDVAVASIVALVLVVVADVILIPRYGLAGAAWASVAAYSVMGALTHNRLRRRIAEPAGA